jgi:hypothetical protein
MVLISPGTDPLGADRNIYDAIKAVAGPVMLFLKSSRRCLLTRGSNPNRLHVAAISVAAAGMYLTEGPTKSGGGVQFVLSMSHGNASSCLVMSS